MAESYQFHLAKWNERDKHLRCPGCGKSKGCFKEYVDDNGNPVDSVDHTVGKCDHTTSCGYHLTPKEWFQLGGKSVTNSLRQTPSKEVRSIEIEGKLVGQFHQHTKQVGNIFIKWVESLPLTDDQRKCLPTLIALYAIGTTKDGRIIWWQIDENRKVRTGKIMAYDDNGHRCKDDEGNSLGFGWVHAMLRRQGKFVDTDTVRYDITQCLFGQHLLPICPDAEVHIVESEKTAFLMSIFDPLAMSKHVWLATGGLYNLNKAKLQPMKGRRIVCYPDANGIDKWCEAVKGTEAKVSATWVQQARCNGSGDDIADVVIRRLLEGKAEPQPTVIEPHPLLSHPIVQLLTQTLNLTPHDGKAI